MPSPTWPGWRSSRSPRRRGATCSGIRHVRHGLVVSDYGPYGPAGAVMVGVPAQDDATRAQLLLRLARQVTARHDLDDVLAEVFRCLRPVVEFGGGSIQLLDDEGWIQMAASDPAAPEHVMAQRVPLATSVAGRVVLTEAPVYLPDIAADAGAAGRRVSEGVRSYLGVPLLADGQAIGLLQVDSPDVDAWTDEEQGVFVTVAPIVAAAIQNARAHTRAGLA